MRATRVSLFILLLVCFEIVNAQIDRNQSFQVRLDAARAIEYSNPDSAFSQAANLATQTDASDYIKGEANHTLAGILMRQGLPNLAINYFYKAARYHKRTENLKSLGWAYTDIGNIHFHREAYSKADTLYQMADSIFSMIENVHGRSTLQINYGLIEREKGVLDKAENHFLNALEMRESLGDSALIGDAYKYLGDLYFQKNDLKKAEKYYKLLENLGVSGWISNLKGTSNQAIGEIAFLMGDRKKALRHFRAAEQNYKTETNMGYLADLYLRISELYMDTDKKTALDYLNRALFVAEKHELPKQVQSSLERMIGLPSLFTDSERVALYSKLDSIKTVQHSIEIQRLLESNRFQNNVFQLEQKLAIQQEEAHRARLVRNGAVLMGLLLILFLSRLYYLYNERKKTHKKLLKQHDLIHQKELQLKELEAKEAMSRTDQKQRELLTKATNILQKNSILQKIKEEIKYRIEITNGSEKKHLKSVYELVSQSLAEDDYWKEFEQHFTAVNPDFIELLSDRFPELTSTDLKMCAFLKMNLSTKEIHSLTGVTKGAIEVRRHRLRKKLGLSKETNLNSYLNKIRLQQNNGN